MQVNKDIAGRPYQLEAIQRVAENLVITGSQGCLKGKHRESLLVMATGSGKTRTAAAIVDMLTKCNWAKRILFLADRNALVRQAKNAFNEHLPHLSAINLSKEKEDNGTRLVFSTYPSIMNKIDSVRSNDERFYGVGHFDLIIIDEAHRSIYQKYHAIFDYFDSLLIGLTATPKKEIDRNTYGLFGIEDDNPTFAYELDSAVKEGYLVPPKSISVPIKFPREGIKYNDLSEKEKLEYEEKFYDPESGEIVGAALNAWLFNTDTVDKVLNHLMTEGIKVEDGDKLGKTIIFAKNHKHAIFIEERFNKNYPEYAGKFLRVIDNYEEKAQDLLERFADEYNEENPQIAVSVDMLDTGVDAPRVVNLVFFKLVKSSSKFWQMIGRGTRLCPNLFAPEEDKTHFIIFDFCQNFEFFGKYPDGIEGSTVKSLTQRIFETKMEVAVLLRENVSCKEDESKLAEQYIDELYKLVSGLDHTRFVVKQKLRHVIEYSNKESWNSLSKGDMLDIASNLSQLMLPQKDDDELARRFDILMLNLQIALLQKSSNERNYIDKVIQISKDLSRKTNIPSIAQHQTILKEIQTELFWQGVKSKDLEKVRLSLRGLIKFLDVKDQEIVYTNFEDEIDIEKIKEWDGMGDYNNLKNYKDRVETYIRKNKNHLTIHKIITNRRITKKDLVELENILFDDANFGTREDYIKEYGDQPLGVFIRKITGLEIEAANEAFSDFISTGSLTADQMKFINTIITYLSKNGIIDEDMLFEQPFTNINDQGISGVFNDKEVVEVIRIIDIINSNVIVA